MFILPQEKEGLKFLNFLSFTQCEMDALSLYI
jgi:hypothetical protein